VMLTFRNIVGHMRIIYRILFANMGTYSRTTPIDICDVDIPKYCGTCAHKLSDSIRDYSRTTPSLSFFIR